jgi:hypothetical protein
VALASLVLALISLWRTHFRGPKLEFIPSDSLGLVRGPLGGLSAIHLMGTLVNGGGATGTLVRLEAAVVDGKGNEHHLVWQLFYRYREGGGAFDKVSDPQPIAVRPSEAVPVFIQLYPADRKIRFEWPPGECCVRLSGWVNAVDRTARPQLRREFRVAVDVNISVILREAGELNLVLRAPVVEWRHPEEARPDPLVGDDAG